MQKFFNWKIVVIIGVAILLLYFDSPDRFQKIPFTPNFIKDAKIHLGLDLQGGTQLDYKIDLRKVEEKDKKQILDGIEKVINRRVNNLGVSEPNIYLSEIADENHIIVELAGIKDIEEAKKVVGKTIQLEFKEEAGEVDKDKQKDIVSRRASAILQKILKTPSKFELISQEETLANPSKTRFKTTDFEYRDQIQDEKFASELFKAAPSKIIPKLIEANLGYELTREGQVQPQEGFVAVKVLEKKDAVREIKHEKEVETSHVLIAYQGAQRAAPEITRNKGEAYKFAKELFEKIKKGEKKFEDSAKESSDEPGAKESAGKLAAPVKKDGTYVEEFTNAALALEKDLDLAGPVETKFGFHIIRANKVKPEFVEKKTEPQVKYAYLLFSTLPDPWKETGLTGEHFKHADVQFDQLYQPRVSIKFNDEGAKLFEEITERNVTKRVAIFVGGDLISAPVVNEKIAGGEAVITGNFTLKEAQELARDLNTGAIPAPVLLSGQYSIGATLGEQALTDSVKAGIIGIIVLMIFMILYYRLPGLIAVIALSIYSVLFLFLLKSNLPLIAALAIAVIIFIGIIYHILRSQEPGWEKLLTFVLSCFILFLATFLLSTPVTLTLAGVAGVILSIGMAVDANVLIFERMKEELHSGRPLSSAIEIGFERAWSSIRDSNFSSLITCAILFYFGTSIIKGFALTLAAGILISMFTAINITKLFLLSSVRTKFANNLWLYCLPKRERKTFNIIGRMKLWFILSGAFILLGIGGLIFNGLNLGMDFKGGALFDIKFEKQINQNEIQSSLAELNLGNIIVTPSGEKNFILRLAHIDNETHDKILNTLKEDFGNLEETRFTTIGPTVSATLKNRALLALGIAFIAIILYIAFAFRKVPKKISAWKFGICAVIALIHDTFIPIGLFALFRVEIDAFLITALLTIIGFSVHDTIVVYDRIRENLKTADRDQSFAEIANKSVNQTLARSINTSFTTLLALFALLIFGSPSIFYFVFALILGIFFGTYSSIFLASPLLALWQKKKM